MSRTVNPRIRFSLFSPSMWRVINSLKIFAIVIWTLICIFLGCILLLLTQSKEKGVYMTSQVYSSFIFWICGIKLIVSGKENIDPSVCYIYVANHESYMDIPALFLAAPRALFFIAKRELRKIPLMGWFMKINGMIFIDRGNRESALRSLKEAGDTIKTGRNVISFPEGTRSKDGELKLFKRGSFIIAKDSDIPILPVAIEGAFETLNPGKTRIRSGTIKVKFGKAILPKDYDHLNEDALAELAQTRVKELLISM